MRASKTISFLGLLGVVGLAISGCTSTGGSSAIGESYQNSETVSGLIYYASGSQGDGADDARVTIEPIGAQTEELTAAGGTDTLLPYTVTTGGADGAKVRMTVESLSSDGEVECQVSYLDMIIHNEASGDHAVAVCEGVLSSWDARETK